MLRLVVLKINVGVFCNYNNMYKMLTCTKVKKAVFWIADFDECKLEDGGCEQRCVNQIASFECLCYDGYTLNSDGFNCNGMFGLK